MMKPADNLHTRIDENRKKILLINPSPREFQTKFLPKNLPLALLSLASNLVDSYEIVILDRSVDRDDKQLARILEDPNLICVGVSVLTGPIIKDALVCSRYVKDYRKDVLVVWGGWHATKVPESILEEPCVDFIVQGEGEYSFRALVDSIGNLQEQQLIPGVGYRRENEIVLNPPCETLNLDELPLIPVELINDIEPYIIYEWIPGGKRCVCWETSRGCPYGCSFCDVYYYFKKSYSGYGPERMIKYVNMLKESFSIGGIRFYDPNFFLDLKRIKTFSERMIQENVNIVWGASGTIQQFKDISSKELKLFYDAGLRYVEFGIESADEAFRSEVLNKKFKNSDTLTVLSKFQEIGLQFKFNIMLGFPDESIEETFASVDYALDIVTRFPDSSIGGHLYIYMPFPGTALFKRALAKGYKAASTLDEFCCVDYSTAEANPWLSERQKRIIEVISVMSYFLSAPKNALPFKGLKRHIFKILRHAYVFRLRHRLFARTPDISILQNLLH